MGKNDAPRVATVCVRGAPAQSSRENPNRVDLIRDAADRIERRARNDPRWRDLDALIFPGGYFRLQRNSACAGLSTRIDALDESGLVGPLREAAKGLPHSPRIRVVAGADGPESDKTRASEAPGGGDQLCVAWRSEGVAGIGRKIFPVWEAYPKTRDYEGDRYVCCADDYGTDDRVISLGCGRSAVLCACYDMFGVADCSGGSDIRAKKIQHISVAGETYHREEATPADGDAFARVRNACIERWRDLLRRRSVTAALVAIHEFPGTSSSFWQRHGVAGASGALGGGLAIGAAHFRTLPSALDRSTLASRDVPARHQRQGQSRRAHQLAPADGFEIAATQGTPHALVRLFA